MTLARLRLVRATNIQARKESSVDPGGMVGSMRRWTVAWLIRSVDCISTLLDIVHLQYTSQADQKSCDRVGDGLCETTRPTAAIRSAHIGPIATVDTSITSWTIAATCVVPMAEAPSRRQIDECTRSTVQWSAIDDEDALLHEFVH
jgi:hypothetical protein